MDRGRVGYDLVGNKALREKEISTQMKVHSERLLRIKHRKPGSSPTLDNLPPVTISCERLASNPRKKKIQDDNNITVERQNKVLLQRIGNILTAPPKITDEDYLRMKSLMPSLRGPHILYEESIKMKRNKEFFARLKTMGSYYKPKNWENDYKKQLEVQSKFMRQVKYKRPKGFVDPFAPIKEEAIPSSLQSDSDFKNKGRVSSNSAPGKLERLPPRPSPTPSSSYSHVNRVREAKLAHHHHHAHGHSTPKNQGRSERSSLNDASDQQSSGYGDDPFDPEDADNEENRRDLAQIHRMTRVTIYDSRSASTVTTGSSSLAAAPSSPSSPGQAQPPVTEDTGEKSCFDILADVRCWFLVKRSVLVISAITLEGGSVQAVAEVDLTQLASLNGHSTASILSDHSIMVELAESIVNSVEISLEDGDPQLLLLMASVAVEKGGVAEEGNTTGGYELQQASDVEVESMMKDVEPITLSRGAKIPYYITTTTSTTTTINNSNTKNSSSNNNSSNSSTTLSGFGDNNNNNSSSNNTSTNSPTSPVLPVLRRDLPTEDMYGMVRIKRVGEDKIKITVTFFHASNYKITRGKSEVPSLSANSTLGLLVGLPSVMLADEELFNEYFENVTASLSVEYSLKDACNNLILKS